MPAHSPEDIHRLFAERFQAGGLDGLLALYEPDAVLMPQPNQIVTGHAAIREALSGFLALQGRFDLRFGQALVVRDVALLFSHWTLAANNPDGSPLNLAGQTSDVVRRHADGTWLIAIDNPYGGAGVGASG